MELSSGRFLNFEAGRWDFEYRADEYSFYLNFYLKYCPSIPYLLC